MPLREAFRVLLKVREDGAPAGGLHLGGMDALGVESFGYENAFRGFFERNFDFASGGEEIFLHFAHRVGEAFHRFYGVVAGGEIERETPVLRGERIGENFSDLRFRGNGFRTVPVVGGETPVDDVFALPCTFPNGGKRSGDGGGDGEFHKMEGTGLLKAAYRMIRQLLFQKQEKVLSEFRNGEFIREIELNVGDNVWQQGFLNCIEYRGGKPLFRFANETVDSVFYYVFIPSYFRANRDASIRHSLEQRVRHSFVIRHVEYKIRG